MELYILRHGIAEEGQAGEPDSERQLTAEGKRKLRHILKVAKAAEVAPTLILTSPYKRAVQTAQIAAEILDYKGDLLRTNALIPSSKPEAVWEELRVHRDQAQVLLAGHEPLFSELTAYLLASPNLQVEFKKGAVVRIDIARFSAEPHGVLKWMLAPKLANA
jgi:phosphohistidine phosphatase